MLQKRWYSQCYGNVVWSGEGRLIYKALFFLAFFSTKKLLLVLQKFTVSVEPGKFLKPTKITQILAIEGELGTALGDFFTLLK